MEQAKELLIKHLKALPIGYNETEMLQCLNDKKSEEGMLLNAMFNAVTEALNIHSVSGSANDFETELYKLVNNFVSAGLSKTELLHKMRYVTNSCELS